MMKFLYLLPVFLIVFTISPAKASDRIPSFAADNFENIANDPTFRWSFDADTFFPLGNQIQLSEFENAGPTLTSLSPTAVLESEDCIFNQCINIRGGSPSYELISTGQNFTTEYTPGGAWTLNFYFKFNEFPTAGELLPIIGIYNQISGQRSWLIYFNASSQDFDLVISTDGINTSVIDGPNLPTNSLNWYQLTLTGLDGLGFSWYLSDETGILDQATTASIPFAATSAPLFFLGNAITIFQAGTDTNYIDDYELQFDEILFWNDYTISEAGIEELAALITSPQTLIPEVVDYQLVSAVGVTNTTGSAITNLIAPYSINFADLVNFGFLDSTLKNYFVASEEFSLIDYMITAGNPVENNSYVFTKIPSIADNQTYTINQLVGLSQTDTDHLYEVDYPFIFDGDDLITIADVTALEFTSNFSVSLAVSIPEAPTTKAWLIDKLNTGGTTGYGLSIDTNGDIIAQIDDETCTLAAASISYPIIDTISMYMTSAMEGPSVQIAIGSDIQTSCSIGIGTANNDDLNIGENLEGNIYQIELRNENTDTTTALLEFNPTDFDQTQEGNSGNSWTWVGDLSITGTVTSGGTYTIVSDLTNITIDPSGLIPNNPEEIPVVPTANPNIIGTPPSVITTPNASINLPFTPIIIDSADSLGITDQALWFLFFYAIAVLVGFGIHLLLNTEFLSLSTMSLIVLSGTLSSVYAAWLSAATIPLILGVYALVMLRRVGQA